MSRERLPNRRSSLSFGFAFEGHQYRATVSAYPDGRLGELFLDCHKPGTALQANAAAAAMLASLCLQHGVEPATLIHSIKGPVAAALQLATKVAVPTVDGEVRL